MGGREVGGPPISGKKKGQSSKGTGEKKNFFQPKAEIGASYSGLGEKKTAFPTSWEGDFPDSRTSLSGRKGEEMTQWRGRMKEGSRTKSGE